MAREECCVCLHRTRQRTACGHALCKHCLQRLRRSECPYCRQGLEKIEISSPKMHRVQKCLHLEELLERERP